MINKPHILIIRLSSIGDVLHATPVARALKAAYPACRITWMVSKVASSLLARNPYIDQVFVWSREEFEQAAAKRQTGPLKELWHELRGFYRKHHFDLVLDVHGLFLTGAIAALSKSPRRIGMAKTKELNRYFMTELAPAPAGPHVIDRYLSALLPLGITAPDRSMTLALSPADHDFAAEFIAAHGVDPRKKLLIIQPRTSWPSKNWGDENFAKLLDLLHPNIQVLLCGSQGDKENAARLKALCDRPLFDAVGKTSLPELGALIKRADLLLTGDTGALHIAIALGVPTISLWGPTRPEQYGPPPGSAIHTIIKSPRACTACHKVKCGNPVNDCMRAIAPDFVAKKVNESLQ